MVAGVAAGTVTGVLKPACAGTRAADPPHAATGAVKPSGIATGAANPDDTAMGAANPSSTATDAIKLPGAGARASTPGAAPEEAAAGE